MIGEKFRGGDYPLKRDRLILIRGWVSPAAGIGGVLDVVDGHAGQPKHPEASQQEQPDSEVFANCHNVNTFSL